MSKFHKLSQLSYMGLSKLPSMAALQPLQSPLSAIRKSLYKAEWKESFLAYQETSLFSADLCQGMYSAAIDWPIVQTAPAATFARPSGMQTPMPHPMFAAIDPNLLFAHRGIRPSLGTITSWRVSAFHSSVAWRPLGSLGESMWKIRLPWLSFHSNTFPCWVTAITSPEAKSIVNVGYIFSCSGRISRIILSVPLTWVSDHSTDFLSIADSESDTCVSAAFAVEDVRNRMPINVISDTDVAASFLDNLCTCIFSHLLWLINIATQRCVGTSSIRCWLLCILQRKEKMSNSWVISIRYIY